MPTNAAKNQMEHAHTILGNIDHDQELQHILETIGYDAAELSNARTLYDHAQRLSAECNSAEEAQLGATKKVVALRDLVADQAQMLSQMAHRLFSNDAAARETLGLCQKPADRSQSTFLASAALLYDGAISSQNLQDALAKAGYSSERIEVCRSKLADLAQASSAHEQRTVATAQKKAEHAAALDMLDAWLQRLYAVAKSALAEREDLLEKLAP